MLILFSKIKSDINQSKNFLHSKVNELNDFKIDLHLKGFS